MYSTDEMKKKIGKNAAELVKDHMKIGLGTGSTATFFIEALRKRCQEGLIVHAVASSERSKTLALEGNIPLLDVDEVETLDICFDGADEIDPHKRMIKGGGGALLREKIVASMSQEMIVLVNEQKLVKKLGTFPLAVEIIPFCHQSTIYKIREKGFEGKLRKEKGNLYITDEGHYLYDIENGLMTFTPEIAHQILIEIPGVVETGLFINFAGRVIVGKENGEVEIW